MTEKESTINNKDLEAQLAERWRELERLKGEMDVKLKISEKVSKRIPAITYLISNLDETLEVARALQELALDILIED